VRRAADHEVKLLANALPLVKPGTLLAAEGRGEWPGKVFSLSWPMARTSSFSAAEMT
jgi:hypothetical protein